MSITTLVGSYKHVGVSMNGGTPKWMVHMFIWEIPLKIDDLGVPLF